jgi:MFS family permease
MAYIRNLSLLGEITPAFAEITPAQWRTLLAAMLGWMLDAMDVMLYSFALVSIQQEFSLSGTQSGLLTTAMLFAAALGGILAGYLADRIGRTRVLMASILIYSLFTAAIATATSFEQLLFWRVLVGIGLGAEWSAGTVLVAESWPARHRGKAIAITQSGWAIGYILASLLAAAILPVYGWRPLFAIGILPALLTLWIRRAVPEPAAWSPAAPRQPLGSLWRPPLRRYVLVSVSMASLILFAYWGLFTWVPAYLASPVDKGGAGLSVVRSTGFIIPMQLGALAGYLCFGFLADRFGRRPVFVGFLLGAAVVTYLYGGLAQSPGLLLALGPLVGFFGHGYYSAFGAILSELFPSGIRATAQGLCYNGGRVVSALAPAGIGFLADRQGIGAALAMTAAFFALGGLLIFGLPETKGRDLT